MYRAISQAWYNPRDSETIFVTIKERMAKFFPVAPAIKNKITEIIDIIIKNGKYVK